MNYLNKLRNISFFSNMSSLQIKYVIISVLASVIVLFILLKIIRRRHSVKRQNAHVAERWVSLQKNCATRKTWPKAIVEADGLLDEVLKSRGYKGKTTGERLVAAQHDITSNDSVWFGHKLSKQIIGTDVRTIKKQDVINALAGFRQALKDLGALEP